MQDKLIEFIDVTERVPEIRDEPWRLYWFQLDMDEDEFLRDPGPILVASKLAKRVGRLSLRIANAYVPKSASSHTTGLVMACSPTALFSNLILFRHPKDPQRFQQGQTQPRSFQLAEAEPLPPISQTIVDVSSQVPELSGEPWHMYWSELSPGDAEVFLHAPKEYLIQSGCIDDAHHVTVHIANPWVPLYPGQPCCRVVLRCSITKTVEVIMYRHEQP